MDGANTKVVLEEYCKKFRFHCREVDEEGARDALNKQRPVVARLYLHGNQWRAFGTFWDKKENKKRVMKAKDLPEIGIKDGDSGVQKITHIWSTGYKVNLSGPE